MNKQILVTGGAGYIGAHTIKQLGEAGYEIVVYDNLSTGVVGAITYGKLVTGDLADRSRLQQVFAQHDFEAVLHFAASISVPDSLIHPLAYYRNNTANTLNLLQCCQEFGVDKLIFSSTAAVYGQPEVNPINEETLPQPLNPYGSSKLMSERLIRDYAAVSPLKYVILRYFNVAGAEIGGTLGQAGKASHLIAATCDAALGRRPFVGVFGTDFDTPDGTGVRDYIHVDDLARAHVDALAYLDGGGDSQLLNCGYGKGYSVRQVIAKVKEISGVDFRVVETERRAGDPACVIAAAERITQILGWRPRYDDLDTMIGTALNWEKRRELSAPAAQLDLDISVANASVYAAKY
jgi:UDP-glucose 4-epimerase